MKIDWKIVDKISEMVAYFVDRHDPRKVYAEYKNGRSQLCFSNVESRAFAAFIRIWYKKLSKQRDVPNIAPIIESFKDEASFFEELEAVDPYTRIAGNLKDGIEYFLSGSTRGVVSICDGSWTLTAKPKHKFLTSSSHNAQVSPVRSNKNIFELLRPCVNLQGDDFTLFVIWMIQNFSGGSHYGLMLEADRGSGKSTLTKTMNQLIDPSNAEATILQSRLDDLQTYLANHYLVCFDNVRNIPTDFSDTLCTAITGGTVVKRQLFTTSDTAYLRLHNAVIMNGISICPAESDLADRLLFFHMNKITAKKRKSDYALNKYLRENRSVILGCIFDILAKATLIAPNLDPDESTRMASAYTEMLAIALALDLPEQKFNELIFANIAKLHQVCANSPLVEAICEYMNGPMHGKRKTVETSTDFFTHVKSNYSGVKSDLPRRAADFSKRLKAEHDALFAAGFSSIVDDTNPAHSIITIIREKH